MDPAPRAQGISNWDLSITKLTPVRERVRVIFGAEFFSLFNRVQFVPPNTSTAGKKKTPSCPLHCRTLVVRDLLLSEPIIAIPCGWTLA
jgi:hypothetical protein